MTVVFASSCSGIGAPTVAWSSLGWREAWVSEIDPFASAVLECHYPDVPNLGDMTRLPEWIRSGLVTAPEVFVAGTPCQAFSVAGLRNSLADARGNLSLTYCEIIDAIDHARAERNEQPCIAVWENVPGVLSTKDNAFGCFLAGLAGEDVPLVAAGGKWPDAGLVVGPARAVAWRLLDAQFFGVAQRRRRVFVVASARGGFDPGAVLFEFDGVRRDTPPSHETREGLTSGTRAGAPSGSGGNPVAMAHGQGGAEISVGLRPTLTCNHEAPIAFLPETVGTLCADAHPGRYSGQDAYTGRLLPHLSHTLRAEGFDASEDGTGRGTPRGPVASREVLAFSCKDSGADVGNVSPTLRAMGGSPGQANGGGQVAVAFQLNAQPDQMRFDPHTTSTLTCSQGADSGPLPFRKSRRAQSAEDYETWVPDAVSNTLNCFDVGDVRSVDLAVQPPTMKVRRLTPRECERLQGFPDDYTRIPWRRKPAEDCPDGPRYKALGNSMAVPVMEWIGARIVMHLEGII